MFSKNKTIRSNHPTFKKLHFCSIPGKLSYKNERDDFPEPDKLLKNRPTSFLALGLSMPGQNKNIACESDAASKKQHHQEK